MEKRLKLQNDVECTYFIDYQHDWSVNVITSYTIFFEKFGVDNQLLNFLYGLMYNDVRKLMTRKINATCFQKKCGFS